MSTDAQRLERDYGEINNRKHLYFPQELGDQSGMYKNAVRFKVYAQNKAKLNVVSETPIVKQPPSQYLNSNGRNFPVNAAAFATFGASRSIAASPPALAFLRLPPGTSAETIENLAVLGRFGLSFIGGGTPGASLEDASYGKRTKDLKNTILLYMPELVTNIDRHDYQPISINQAAGRAGLFTAANPLAPSLNVPNLAEAEIVAELAGRAGIFGTRPTEAFLAGLGYALNPMLEQVYGGSQNRRFQFVFTFVPRNQKESDELLNIIKTFRFHSHSESADRGQSVDSDPVAGGTGTRYLVPPNLFEIEFLRRKVTGKFQENSALPRIAPCMLTSVQVEYSADTPTFATFRDGQPVSIRLSMEFMESIILSKLDIQNGY